MPTSSIIYQYVAYESNSLFCLPHLSFLAIISVFGTSIDLAKAFELYLESANAGYGKGMELVGRFYNRGIYVQRDRKQAEHWLLRAMESTDSAAVEEAKKELAIE